MRFKQSALAIIAGVFAIALKPAAIVTPSAWAAENLVVPDGPYAGEKFNPRLTPYVVEPLDLFSNEVPDNKAVVRKSAQTGFTLVALAATGFTIAVEPCRMMLVQPTDAALADFNREKLQIAIEQTPALRKRVRAQTSRSAQGSTTYSKRYPGGSLTLAIATSTADLRSKTVRKVIKDEASEYPADLDGQGSPHDMIEARYESFRASGDWKELDISTPTIKGACYIDGEFEAGDQRFWHVRCPGCGDGEFVFRFGPQFKFEQTFPHKAHYVAPCCGSVIEHAQKNALVREGRWLATAPGAGKHRSYHFDALSSPFVPWDLIAERAVASQKDNRRQKTFDNLTLGIAHDIKGDAPDHERLMALREDYARGRIPPRGLILVGAADVQANGIYVEIVAYAPNRESWTIDALVLDGDTTDPNGGAFAKLTTIVEKRWPDSFGNTRKLDAFGIDSGFRTHVVYTWVRNRDGAYALKGADGWGRAPLSSPTLQDVNFAGKKIKSGVALWPVGTFNLKNDFFSDLRKKRLAEGAEIEPAGACHHGAWLDDEYFRQITNEYLERTQLRGRTRMAWKERGPNHWLDCRVYCGALAEHLGLSSLTQDEWRVVAKQRAGDLADADLFAPAPLAVQAASEIATPLDDALAAAASEQTATQSPAAPSWRERGRGWWDRS